jgi:hypothetical protein
MANSSQEDDQALSDQFQEGNGDKQGQPLSYQSQTSQFHHSGDITASQKSGELDLKCTSADNIALGFGNCGYDFGHLDMKYLAGVCLDSNYQEINRDGGRQIYRFRIGA